MAPDSNGGTRSRLYERTMQLLANRPKTVTLQMISDETGLPKSWLLSIVARPQLSPSVDRIEKLYRYLTANPVGPLNVP